MKNQSFSLLFKTPKLHAALMLALLSAAIQTEKIMAQCPLICNDLIEVQVPDNGTKELLPEDIAEGDLSAFCPNGVFQTQAQIGNMLWVPASGNVVFDPTHIGNTYPARLHDSVSGNTCWGNVSVVAAPPPPDTIHFQLCARYWKDDLPIKGATLTFQPNNPSFPYSPLVFVLDTSQSCVDLSIAMTDYLPGTTFEYSASLPDTNYSNGMSYVDLCRISKHILGIDPLPSPYAMIAADANKSASINTFDIVEFRKVILGIYTQLPNNTVWRFVADYCNFPNPNNPFQIGCATSITAAELAALNGGMAKVIGIKAGDVDGDASLNGKPYLGPKTMDSVTMLLPQGQLLPGVSVAIPVKFDKDILLGSLYTLFSINPALARYDSLSDALINITASNSAVYDTLSGKLFFSFSSISNLLVPAGTPLFYIHFTPKQLASIPSVLNVIQNDPDLKTYAVNGNSCGFVYEIGSAYTGTLPSFSPESRGVSVQPPSPNPFDQQTFLEVELEKSQPAVLQVIDLTGRIVYSQEKILPAGMSRWEIPGSALAPGSLGIWRLMVGERRIAGKLARK